MKWKFDTENHIFMTAAVAFDINYYSCHSKKQWNATIWDWLTIFLYYADFWAPQEKAVLCVCVCVWSRPPTPKQHCAYLLNCLSSSSTKSSGLFWLLGFEMCRLWQTCGISPVLLGKTSLSDCGNSVGLLHHFIHTSCLPFGEGS